MSRNKQQFLITVLAGVTTLVIFELYVKPATAVTVSDSDNTWKWEELWPF